MTCHSRGMFGRGFKVEGSRKKVVGRGKNVDRAPF